MENNSNIKKGHLHPITMMIREIYNIFSEIGFVVAEGPELETEFYNFDALNVPKDHPSRDMQDTFWLKPSHLDEEKKLLRTHTSSVQIRYMEQNNPPFKIIVPGKVFRNEATDATHEAQFYQLEALVVDRNITLGDLKGVLLQLFKRLFDEEVDIRFRPSYFPFTEPSVEVDMYWKKSESEKGKWLEMGGAGMVHPNVFKAAGVDPILWRGFAFGFGIDRLVMLKFGIEDVRHLYSGDLRIINQF
jgi:phenylalanyl-tRNA synthetase alpha chain